MEWTDSAVQISAAAAGGFFGGWIAVLVHSRRLKAQDNPAHAEPETVKEADWAVKWLMGNTWVLSNVGTARATDIDVSFEEFVVGKSHIRTSMRPTEEASFVGLRRRTATALISWTNADGERVGPVRRAVPPKMLYKSTVPARVPAQ